MTEQVYYMLLRVPGGRMLHHKEIAARGPSFTYRVDNTGAARIATPPSAPESTEAVQLQKCGLRRLSMLHFAQTLVPRFCIERRHHALDRPR